MRAIEHAHRVLDWQENLTEEETPPKWMWCFEDELGKWFDEVKQNRGVGPSGDGDGHEVAPQVGNELTASLLEG